jgi:hypothetical protein
MKKILLLSILLCFSFYNKDCNYCESLEKVLKNKILLDFLHIKENNRSVLYLEENKYCNLNKDILKNFSIKTLSKKEISNKKNVIFLENIEITEKENYKIILFYPIEGVYFEAFFKNKSLYKIETIEK